MPLTNAKCTNCGSNLEVDPAKEAAVCTYCDSAFVVEKAINNYNIANAQINAGVVNVQTGGSAENFLQLAKSAQASGKNNEAEEYCKRTLELEPGNYEAWLLRAKIHSYGLESKNMISLDYYKHALDNAPFDTRETVKDHIAAECFSIYKKALLNFDRTYFSIAVESCEDMRSALSEKLQISLEKYMAQDYSKIIAEMKNKLELIYKKPEKEWSEHGPGYLGPYDNCVKILENASIFSYADESTNKKRYELLVYIFRKLNNHNLEKIKEVKSAVYRGREGEKNRANRLQRLSEVEEHYNNKIDEYSKLLDPDYTPPPKKKKSAIATFISGMFFGAFVGAIAGFVICILMARVNQLDFLGKCVLIGAAIGAVLLGSISAAGNRG